MSATSDDSLFARHERRLLQTSASRACIDIIFSASGRFHIASKYARESKFVPPGLKKVRLGRTDALLRKHWWAMLQNAH